MDQELFDLLGLYLVAYLHVDDPHMSMSALFFFCIPDIAEEQVFFDLLGLYLVAYPHSIGVRLNWAASAGILIY